MTRTDRDRRWLEAVFAAHHRAVLAYALRRVPPDDADDVLAEVFASAWRHRDRVPDRALPWLYRAASNHILHARRSHGRRSRLSSRLLAEPVAWQPDPADAVAHRLDTESSIRAAMSTLRAGDAEILRLSAWEELPLDEIAYVLNCTPASARVRLHRARGRLSAALHHIEASADAAREATA